MKQLWILIALVVLLLGCTSPAAPVATVASTVTATPSSTPASSETSRPTNTATLASTIGATSQAPTSEVAGSLSCNVLSQSMRNGRRIGPKERFDMAWKVRNDGTAAWDPSNVVFSYFSGTRMQVSDTTYLKETVQSGDAVLLMADMVAPKSSGYYTTVWTLRQGDQDFCHVSVTIYVP